MLKNSTQQTKGWFYGIVSQLLWGSGGVSIKLIDAVLPSSLLVSLRHGIGAITLLLLILKGKTSILKNLPMVHLIILGIVAAGITDLLLVEAVRRVGAIIATMLARVEIPLGVLLAHFLLKEKVNKQAYIAGLLSIVGVCLISWRPDLKITITDQFYSGILFALAAATLWGLSSVYAKYIFNNKQTDPLAVSFVRICIGSIFALIITFVFFPNPLMTLQQLNVNDWTLLLYLGIFLSGLGYLFFYRSLRILDAHVAIILIGLSIVVGLTLGLLIGETIRPLQWVGIILIMGSIFLVKRSTPEDAAS